MIYQEEIIQLTEDDDPIDIRYDNMFKAVFTKESPQAQRALSKLISALIEREVSVISIAANEPASESIRDRNMRFDINCRTERGERINVEMSFNREPFSPARLEYHTARLFIGQDIRGKDKTYADLKEAYQITILANIKLFTDEESFHTFEYFDPMNKIPLGGKSRIITAELMKLDKIVEKNIIEMNAKEHWAVFFRYLTDKSRRDKINEILKCEEGIAMAGEVLMTISKDDIERTRLESKLRRELDLQSWRVEAERRGRAEGLAVGQAEGLAKGLTEGLAKGQAEGFTKGQAEGFTKGQAEGFAKGQAEGLAKGQAEGLARGLTEGLTEGQNKAKKEIALKLKARGIPLEEIANDTGLSVSEIENL